MIIKTLAVGPIMANCYIVGCENSKQAAVIDPGDDADRILMTLAEDKLTVKYILNTHGHFDHVGANRRIKDASGAELLINAKDAPMLDSLPQAAAAFGLSAESSPAPDRTIADGDRLTVRADSAAKTDVLDAVEATGADVRDFSTEQASLDDVFAAYTEEVRA